MKILKVISVCKTDGPVVRSRWHCIFFDTHRSYTFRNCTEWVDTTYQDSDLVRGDAAIWVRGR